MHLIIKIGRWVLGWLVYSLLLTATFFTREYYSAGIQKRIGDLTREILQAYSVVIQLLISGFILYGLLYAGLTRWKKLRGNSNVTIFLVVIFHIIMGFSFFFSYVFTRPGDMTNAGIEIQLLLAIATILFAVIPYFKKHLFEL